MKTDSAVLHDIQVSDAELDLIMACRHTFNCDDRCIEVITDNVLSLGEKK